VDHAQINWFPEEDRKRVSVDGKNYFERFEPLKRDKKKKPFRLSFGVISSKSIRKRRGFEFYEMSSFPHGIALIINNEEFSRQEHREGTGIDEKNLIQTFRYLGYIVEVHRDCSASQMKDIFDEVSTRRDHSKYDSFVCCILSHGEEGKIYGSDRYGIPTGTKLHVRIIFRCAVYTFHCVTVGSMLWGKMYMWHIIYAHLCYYSTF